MASFVLVTVGSACRDDPAASPEATSDKAPADASAPPAADPPKLSADSPPPSATAPAIEWTLVDEEEIEVREGAPKMVDRLPPRPDLASGAIPVHHSGGAWSVAGLRGSLEARLAQGHGGTEIEVKAWVQHVYAAPHCPEDELCPPPEPPHAWIADTPKADHAAAMMLVRCDTNLPGPAAKAWNTALRAALKRGREIEVRGRLVTISDTGQWDARGVLELTALRDASGGWLAAPASGA